MFFLIIFCRIFYMWEAHFHSWIPWPGAVGHRLMTCRNGPHGELGDKIVFSNGKSIYMLWLAEFQSSWNTCGVMNIKEVLLGLRGSTERLTGPYRLEHKPHSAFSFIHCNGKDIVAFQKTAGCPNLNTNPNLPNVQLLLEQIHGHGIFLLCLKTCPRVFTMSVWGFMWPEGVS